MFSLKKKQNAKNESEMKEKFFFHDIINHTHGLLLFLSSKDIHKETLSSDEIKMMINEVKTLQSLIRDHYDFTHKNLVQTLDWVPVSYVKLAFSNLIQNYLNDKNVMTTFEITASEDVLFYYPSFYRITNNLIKNISESKAETISFKLEASYKGLSITSVNEMKSVHERNLPEHLSQVILSEKTPKKEGLGLESIHHLATEAGGTFTFEIKNGQWINKFFIPAYKSKSDKIPA